MSRWPEVTFLIAFTENNVCSLPGPVYLMLEDITLMTIATRNSGHERVVPMVAVATAAKQSPLTILGLWSVRTNDVSK